VAFLSASVVAAICPFNATRRAVASVDTDKRLIELFGEGLDLVHLVVDHLDIFRDFLRCVQDGLRMESGIVNDPLRARRCRDAKCDKRECDELFHDVLSLRSICFSGDTPPITGDDYHERKARRCM